MAAGFGAVVCPGGGAGEGGDGIFESVSGVPQKFAVTSEGVRIGEAVQNILPFSRKRVAFGRQIAVV